MSGYSDNPSALLHAGKYTDGDPGAGIASSRILAEQTNNIVDEMLSVVAEAGLTPDFSATDQLLEAINKLATKLSAVVPVSSGSTTTLYGLPMCGVFAVALPDLVDGNVYRFIPHATNVAGGGMTINGIPVKQFANDVVNVVGMGGGNVQNPRYKAVRPDTVAHVMYRESDNIFIILDRNESEILHDSFASGAALTNTSHTWTVTKTGTGTYVVSTGIKRTAHVYTRCYSGDYIVSATTMNTSGEFTVTVKTFAGALSDATESIGLLLVL